MNKIIYCVILMLLFYCAAFAKSGTLYSYEVEIENGDTRYGYKAANGNVVLDAVYPYIYTEQFDKAAFVINKEYKLVGINKKGETVIVPFIFDNGPDYIEEGLFRFVENGKMGFADENMKKVIPAQYDFVSAFDGGLAHYVLGGEKKYYGECEHWIWAGGYENGYINKKNEKFKAADELHNGRRNAVTFDGKYIVLNEKGNIIEKKKEEVLVAFNAGDEEGGRWGYKDNGGNVVIAPQYYRVDNIIMDRMARVLLYRDGMYSWLCIDRRNNVLFKPFLVDGEPDWIFEGLFRFVENDKIGFADEAGNVIIPAQFDFVTPFQNGKAQYYSGGHKEFIDLSKDHFEWKGYNETGFINRKGRRVKK